MPDLTHRLFGPMMGTNILSLPPPRGGRMSDLKQLIVAADGAHAVFLAAKHDAQLAGTITTTQKGTLHRNGRPVGDKELANILVYLTGQYGIKPSKWELMAGLVAAAEKKRRRAQRKPPPAEFTKQVEDWLNDKDPSTTNLNITTERIANDIMPEEFEINRRGVEMKTASALRVLGLQSRRVMVNGARRYRWFPTKTP